MLDWLKTILGEVYTDEIDKSVSEEIGKNFVSKSDFNTKNETVKDLTKRLEEANSQIEAFKEMDIDAIKNSADEWKRKAEQAQADADARVKELEHDNLLREKLSGLKFTSEYAKKGVFDEIKSKGLPVNDGKLSGFDDILKEIMEAQPEAFMPDDPPPQFGGKINPPKEINDAAARSIMGLPPEKG